MIKKIFVPFFYIFASTLASALIVLLLTIKGTEIFGNGEQGGGRWLIASAIIIVLGFAIGLILGTHRNKNNQN